VLEKKLLEELFGGFDRISYVIKDEPVVDCECGQKVRIEKTVFGKMEATGGLCGHCGTLHISLISQKGGF